MVEFMLLFRGKDGRSLRLQPDEYQAHIERLTAWMESLQPHGEIVSAEPLGASVKLVRDKGKLITDGPFIEGKEMIGGYCRFRAVSIDAAQAWAQQCPIFEFDDGLIELRPIDVLDL
jgi:hypothetical protein